MIFKRLIENDSDRRGRILYVMGATWHTKCMFDLDTVEPSFCDLLEQAGYETYTFDMLGTGPGNKKSVIGDRHQDNVNIAVDTIKRYNIDYAIGYSYGGIVSAQAVLKQPVKKLLIIEPIPKLEPLGKSSDGDKIYLPKTAALDALKNNKAEINPKIVEDYIKNLCEGDTLVSAAYTSSGHGKPFRDPEFLKSVYNTCPVKSIFTKNSAENVRDIFKDSLMYWPEASHWLLLEEHRYRLVKFIQEFFV
jgi:pimeloyl-ACP methyl ester carboxylesterase